MFFEGSEKKLEVIVESGYPSLRGFGYAFWQSMVKAANAEILSTISNEACDAYLLSESSLFVWDDRFLMLTCGTTTLVESAVMFFNEKGTEGVDFLCYQRKNEYFSQHQKSALDEDLSRLREFVPMRAYQLGYLDSHHHFLAHLDKAFHPAGEDQTSELLMYHIQGEVADYLRSEGQTREGVRERLQLDKLLPGFELDDFVFSPVGYSINAIKGKDYATIHITPEQNSSYVSFESSLDLGAEDCTIVESLLAILQPATWDTVGFNCSPLARKAHDIGFTEHCDLELDCGFRVQFCHHKLRNHAELPVIAL